jgi:hypothetical protein
MPRVRVRMLPSVAAWLRVPGACSASPLERACSLGAVCLGPGRGVLCACGNTRGAPCNPSTDSAWSGPGAKLEKKMGCPKVGSRKPGSPNDAEDEETGEGNDAGGNHNK